MLVSKESRTIKIQLSEDGIGLKIRERKDAKNEKARNRFYMDLAEWPGVARGKKIEKNVGEKNKDFKKISNYFSL